ncbi:IS481 family transposase [Modestobacter sp. VKM Ac-2984]|uniref:IS481 family transposase n=1 Tax=Modestobacter sp. VKM Ac-2984 TaxID=3004138 RepID=UPI0022AB073A|nr:IS481 family transposase [Modestobacter sp. VKM Ac-2984]MCZ2817420.1 IS481 family transposase [Modestobacter sp. VKM Ac-2984]
MSKARLVITAVEVEGRSPAEVIEAYGVSRSWLYELLARYRAEGDAAFEPRSRRPRSSPAATAPATVELVLRLRKELAESGLDAGADTIGWHLTHRHQTNLSRATIHRILTRAGAVTPEPAKRPKSSYIRFAADQPNETWQSDFTHYRLINPDGTPGADIEIITWLDDHSRLALHVTAHVRITGPIVLKTFRQATDLHGYPASTLTDNGTVYTTRFAGGRGGRNHLEHELRRLGITQKNSRPNHPTTCGKVERFQQTLKKWLLARPDQPATLTALQALIDVFVDTYNCHRPHRSLPHRATPTTAYTARPKAGPGADRSRDTHDRVRTDRIDSTGCVTLRLAGRLHHIGVGRTHYGTHVLLLVQDLNVRVIDASTGELLRELTIDPARDYQPTGRPPGPTRR